MTPLRSTLIEHAMVCEACRKALERRLLELEESVNHAIEEGIFPPGRRQADLQDAHDLLIEALQNKVIRERLLPGDLACQMAMAADTLCWALGHTHLNDRRLGNNFHALLADLEIAMRPWRSGFLQEIRKPPEPVRKPPERKSSRKKPESAPAPSMEFDLFEGEDHG